MTIECNQTKLYFEILPLYNEKNTALREYKNKRYIIRRKPPLNLNKISNDQVNQLLNYF